MVLSDNLKDISNTIIEKIDNIQTEEATKTAFIMPFIMALGYNVFDPTEVVPEFIADIGKKRGEKVDYAIMIDDKPVILIECKPCHSNLDKEHASQLYRYFSSTEARFGVLTNGIIYKFYTDIEKPNIMDEKPFFELDMLNINDISTKEINKFAKSSFDLDNILESASELKYKKEIKKIMLKQLEKPSDDFVRFFAKEVYNGPLTQNIREQFSEITKSAFNQFIKEQVEKRLKSALDVSHEDTEEKSLETEEKTEKNDIVTTDEEWEAFYIIRAILHEITDVNRIFIRDRKSYCGILLDNNQNKMLCRLHFNSKNKSLGFFDSKEKDKYGRKNEDRIQIENINDIYKYSDRLKQTVRIYEKE